MNVIYNKNTGIILNAVSDEINYKDYYIHFGEDFISELDSVKIENIPMPLTNYYIENGEIKKYTEQEIKEIEIYGRILTKEERQLEKLKPSLEEVRKAENTIEILTLIQEVI